MIEVEQARRLIMQQTTVLPVKEMPLQAAHRHFAAEDIMAPYDHPLFHNSAVDGYAFHSSPEIQEWRVIAEVAAGDMFNGILGKDECLRIFTGARLPLCADTVIMQEHVMRDGDRIRLNGDAPKRGANVRLKGEQVRAGDVILQKGDPLAPAAIGLLASVGVRKVRVHEWPYVTIVITGGEFSEEGSEDGKIFSSNDTMLSAALAALGVEPLILKAPDAKEPLREALRHALSKSDLVITTGGVSVGDHDLVRPVLEEVGCKIIFHKVAQKPGKPMLFATDGDRIVLGLPGNPRAVMILFWMYVLPAVRKMMGASGPFLRSGPMALAHDVELKGERSEFRAARCHNGTVELLRDEGSHMLMSLMQADSLVHFSSTMRSARRGEMVEVHHLPQP